jgi:hypothetical protein
VGILNFREEGGKSRILRTWDLNRPPRQREILFIYCRMNFKRFEILDEKSGRCWMEKVRDIG